MSRLEEDLGKRRHAKGFDEREGRVSLRWILENQRRYVQEATRAIKSKSYHPLASRKVLLTLPRGKPREIFIQDWVDRIIQSTLAEILRQELEPHLPGTVYSFRKGRSNHQAIRRFAEFAASHSKKDIPIYILRRDIRNFAMSIPVEPMIEKWQTLVGKQEDYILRLMRSMMAPAFIDAKNGTTEQLEVGVVPGSPILPVCANLLLLEVDKKLSASFPGFYARYGDDIIYADTSYENVSSASALLNQLMLELQLAFNEQKSANCCFATQHLLLVAPDFPGKRTLDYLGVSIQHDGSVFLPHRKLQTFKRSIRATARRAYLINRACSSDRNAIIAAIVEAVNFSLSNSTDLPFFNILLMPEINQDAVRKLDCWIAKQCLAPIFGTGHDRVFRSFPYKKLKDLGLRSLRTVLYRRIRRTLPSG